MLHDDSIGPLVTLKREPFNSIKELFLFFFFSKYTNYIYQITAEHVRISVSLIFYL